MALLVIMVSNKAEAVERCTVHTLCAAQGSLFRRITAPGTYGGCYKSDKPLTVSCSVAVIKEQHSQRYT